MGRRALPALLPLLAGCYVSDEDPDRIVFRFATWLLLLVGGVGVALAVVAVLVARSRADGRKKAIAVLLPALVLGLFLPGMALDRVVVTPEEIQQTTGFWFLPNRKGFRYADVHSVRILERVSSKGVPYDVWRIQFRNGRSEELDPGDLWEKSSEVIVPRLRAYGVDVR